MAIIYFAFSDVSSLDFFDFFSLTAVNAVFYFKFDDENETNRQKSEGKEHKLHCQRCQPFFVVKMSIFELKCEMKKKPHRSDRREHQRQQSSRTNYNKNWFDFISLLSAGGKRKREKSQIRIDKTSERATRGKNNENKITKVAIIDKKMFCLGDDAK